MSLTVPLAVKVGDRHITREVSDVSWRKDAVGGVRSITFRLSRPIAQMEADLAPFTPVYVYDSRTAQCIAQGRLSDSGRSADGGGQAWEVVAFGPAQHASDVTLPLVYVDRDLSAWEQIGASSPSASIGSGSKPDSSTSAPGLLTNFPDGTPVAFNSNTIARYRRAYLTGQKIGGFGYAWDAGVTVPNWRLEAVVSAAGNHGAAEFVGASFDTAGGTVAANVVTNFTNGRDTLDLRQIWTGGAATVAGDTTWAWAEAIWVRAMMYDKAGVEFTAGYSGNPFVYASTVVEDLLGRPGVLDEYDGANAVVDANTFVVNHLVYMDGTTAEHVLSDLMALTPAYRWYTGPDVTGNGYQFSWQAWPTTVRYEVSLDDGGSFPISGQNLYNSVIVRWKADSGVIQTTRRTMACGSLDSKGLKRQALLDLGDEVGGTATAAQQAGDSFLAEHNVPSNSGTIKVARPIRDVITGRMVEPHEIEAGELIRVRGVESYPDALNADSKDGRAVFRIHAVDYSSADHSASLTLDADPADTTSALVKLLNERDRRR